MCAARQKPFLSRSQIKKLTRQIARCEKQTSGEFRVMIEKHCPADVIAHAQNQFARLNMHQTAQRNGVLVYVAYVDQKIAIWADEGIHQKVGQAFWNTQVRKAIEHFSQKHPFDALSGCIASIAQALQTYFPYDPHTDKNELPDEIIY